MMGLPEEALSLQQATQVFGKPACAVAYSSAVAAGGKLPAARLWLAVTPDSLAAAGFVAGDLVLVAVTNQTHSFPSSPSSTFAPASLPSVDPQNTHVISLWSILTTKYGSSFLLSTPTTSTPATKHEQSLTAAPVSQSCASQSAPATPTNINMHHYSSSSTSSLSQRSLSTNASSLSQHSSGTYATNFPACLPAASFPGSYLVPAQIWPLAKLQPGTAVLSPQLAACLSMPAAGIILLLYRNTLQSSTTAQQLESKATAQQQHSSATPQHSQSGTQLTPLNHTQPSTTQLLPACTNSLVVSVCCDAASGQPAVLRHASTAQQNNRTAQASSQSTSTPKANSKKSVRPSTPNSTSLSTTDNTANGPAGMSDWLARALASCVTSDQRDALAHLVRSQIEGRAVLPGSPIVAPVLGRSLLCCVLTASLPVTSVTHSTPVTLMLPGEPLPQASDGPDTATAQRQHVNQDAELVAKARRAAEEAVVGSSRQAAADAAERALRAGLSSRGMDWSQLGGIQPYLPTLRELVTLPLRAPHFFERYKVRPPRGVLLYGPPGSGKTVLARAVASEAGANVFVINGPDIVSEFYGESEAGLQGIFAAAAALAPSIIFMDEIDAIAPARQGGAAGSLSGSSASDMSARMVTTLLTLMDGSGNASNAGVVVIAASNRRDHLDPALRRPGRLERELEVGVPTPAARVEILTARLKRMRHSLTADDIQALAASAHGFVSADLAALVDEAAMCALRRCIMKHSKEPQDSQAVTHDHSSAHNSQQPPSSQLQITLEDFKEAETRVRPSGMREVAVEVPNVRWQDVGGMRHVKQLLQEAVEWPQKAPDALKRLGAIPPRGVLLYGPPGCSKTLLAKALAREAGLNFISIKGGELFSKYVGDSEKAVASLFARARAAAPSIVFFDEIDGLAANRASSGGGSGVAERVLAQLLTEMDGLQGGARGVVVVAATNRPDRLDAALLRPGRFDRLIYVPPPDAETRREIFQVHLRRTPLAADISLDTLASQTAGYTGADITAVCREAALKALEEDLSALCVYVRHFEAALQLVPASTPPSGEMLLMYERFQRSAGVGAASNA